MQHPTSVPPEYNGLVTTPVLRTYVVNGATLAYFGVHVPIGGSNWPSQTACRCFYCHHTFTTPPVPAPYSHVAGRFYVSGCYCSIGCVAAWAERTREGSAVNVGLLQLFARRVLGMPAMTPIIPAPDYRMLAAYGGRLSIEEFRAASSLRIELRVRTDPLRPMNIRIEAVDRDDARKAAEAARAARQTMAAAESMRRTTIAHLKRGSIAFRRQDAVTPTAAAAPPRPRISDLYFKSGGK